MNFELWFYLVIAEFWINSFWALLFREGGNIGLKIILMPKILKIHYLIKWLKNFGYLLFQTTSAVSKLITKWRAHSYGRGMREAQPKISTHPPPPLTIDTIWSK